MVAVPALPYPTTRRLDVVDTVGGVTFADPYRWLEEDTPEVRDWMAHQDRLASGYVRGWQHYPAVESFMRRHSSGGLATLPERHGRLWFRKAKLGPDGRAAGEAGFLAPDAVIVAASEPNGDGAVIDMNALATDGPWRLFWYVPSPDGHSIACGLIAPPDPVVHLRFVDVGTLRLSGDIAIRTYHLFPPIAWLADSSGVFLVDGSTPWGRRNVYLHRLGDQQPRPPEPVPVRDRAVAPLQVSADGKYVALLEGMVPRLAYYRDLGAGPEWREFMPGFDGRCHGAFFRGRYVAIITDTAPRGRLVSIPLATAGDTATWTELMPEREGVLWSCSAIGDRLIVSEVIEDRVRMHVLDAEGRREGEVPVPGRGRIGNFASRYLGLDMVHRGANDDEILFLFETEVESTSAYRYDLRRGRLTRYREPEVVLEHLVTDRVTFSRDDGAVLAVDLVHRRDLDRRQPQPVLISGGGNWHMGGSLPDFTTRFLAFVEAGGIAAHVATRGGGEHGMEWWRQGRREHKMNSTDDLCAAAEHLIERGITARGRLALWGGFLGASGPLARRPDLFKVVVVHQSLSDLMRYTRDEACGNWLVQEYGDPRLPEEAPWVLAHSPYHHIRAGESYPATIVMCAAQDGLSAAWHGRKIAAALQHASASGEPVLLRSGTDLDHLTSAIGPPNYNAEWMSFILRELGMGAPS